jgi:hypothetical protein
LKAELFLRRVIAGAVLSTIFNHFVAIIANKSYRIPVSLRLIAYGIEVDVLAVLPLSR